MQILGEKIDCTITQNDTSQNKLRTHVDLQNFIKSHCLAREYSFQVLNLYLYYLYLI